MGGREDRDSLPVSEASDAAASQARAWMVASQLRTRGIADPRVLEAMAEIPRDWFVETSDRTRAYADEALPIPAGQTISQPYIVARMTELLAPRSGDRILEIGTGSGYQAAVLARLNCHVVSIERQPELATTARERLIERGFGDRVEVRLGDGSAGDPSGAPWDGIIVTAAAPSVPASLREQLRTDGGRLVVPVGNRMRQELIVVVRDGDTWREWNDGQVVFVPLIGEEGFPG